MQICKLPVCPIEPEVYFLPREKLISGNPRQTLWMHYTDPTKQFFVGEWHSEVGKWKIAYTEEEYCKVIEGTSVITDDQGNSITLSAGESFVVPRGFHGTWEVVAPTRKTFVLYDAGEPCR
ncbi:MAG: DUF861 domain-containing protein [Paucibacter sp.]|nr:DUF861 domain-containing protein [Roseateles sp.]